MPIKLKYLNQSPPNIQNVQDTIKITQHIKNQENHNLD